jgi:hypothetical protein
MNKRYKIVFAILTVVLTILLHPLGSKGSDIMPTTTPTAATVPITTSNSGINTNVLAAAQSAGKQLGIDPSTLYSQWVLEIGTSLNNSTPANNNPGNIMKAGTKNASEATTQSYASLSDFVTAFVSNIRSTFPSAQNTGSNITAYVAGLSNKSGETYYGNVSAKDYANSIIGIFTGLASSLGAQPANLSISEQNSVNANNVGGTLTFGQKVADTLTSGENAVVGVQNAAQGAVSNATSALDPANWLTPIETWIGKAVHPTVMFILGILLIIVGLVILLKSQIETVTELAAPETIPAIEAEKKLTKGKGK